MKLSEYISKLQETLRNHGDLPVVYSRDDEGNGFQEIYFDPSVGHFNGEDFDNSDSASVNAVCIN